MPISQDKPHYIGHRKRLKERFTQNPRSLPDYELLELLLGYALPRADTKPLAKDLLGRFFSFSEVIQANPDELHQVNGVGMGISTFFAVVQELIARLAEQPLAHKESLATPEAVANMARARFGKDRTEQFWIALVDNQNRLLGFNKLSQGTVDSTHVYPREIVKQAVQADASGIFLVHNHPGGSTTPSNQDQVITKKLYSLSHELGIRFLDHIIVTEDSFFSFQNNRLL